MTSKRVTTQSNGKILVTIGMCVRNCDHIVGNAIESVFAQDFFHDRMEIVFVDDGSTDETLAIIESQIRKSSFPTKVIHQKWRGIGPARNLVLENSLGKYIVWVDCDMLLSKDFVRRQVGFMERTPAVGVGKGSYGMYTANTVSTLENIEFVTTNSKWMRKVDPNPFGTGGSIYRVKTLKEVGGFDDSVRGSGEDAEVEYRIKKAGWLLDVTPAVFYETRRATWRSLWNEYFWHGKGSSRVVKGKTSTRTYKLLPPVAFVIESMRIVVAYRLTRRKIALLLPWHYLFKRTAWFAGLLSTMLHL